MADAVISIVAERVAAIIADQIRYEVNLVRGAEKEIIDLSDKLQTITDVLDDAEKRGVNDQSVKKWLKKLEDMAYEMDDILDEWNYALLKHKMEHPAAEKKVCCSFIPSSCLSFNKVAVRRDIAKKILNVKATLDRILKEKDEFNFVTSLPQLDPVPTPPRVQSTSSIELEKVQGVDIHRNKNDIVRKLRLNGDNKILCIVGMGGIGKTTLAQLVYNDTRVKDCFQFKIWICVADPFDVAGIARGIVESVTKEIIPSNTIQLELVLEKLRDCISGKKFLLVLDDVWTEDYNEWEPLKINLRYGAPGSKILVTTRNERVAKMMMRDNVDVEIYHPQKLSDEECWKLLRHISLSRKSEEECGKFEDAGKKIASKCEGLPLAANVLGSLLQFKDNLEDWRNVLESEIWQLEKAEVDLFPHLLLSYNELSPSLKRCFSYCAVYPKDYQIHVESLIEEWMALGYLGSVTGDGGVDLKGRDYFNNLAMRSLFQEFKKIRHESGREIKLCKMHDIVHDFAQLLKKNKGRVEGAEIRKRSCQVCDPFLACQAQEYRSLSLVGQTLENICDCLTSIRVLRLRQQPRGVKKLIHLRWLELRSCALCKEDLKIICRLYFLQTLLLESCSIKEIPTEIGNLVELRHLDLSNNRDLKVLPESMCSLVELKILNLKHCIDLSGFPEGFHMLENLQHLLIMYTRASYYLPEVVGRLSGLRTLSIESFFAGSGQNKLGLLKNLNRLSGSLRLKIHLHSMSDLEDLVEDAREAELRNKVHIQSLYLLFYDYMDETERSSSSLSMDVMEALDPHQKLKKLEIKDYRGSRLPHWISSPHNLIKEIRLFNLSEVLSLPPMGKLPFLEDLSVERLSKLKLVGREFLGIECWSSSSSSSSSTSSNHVVAVAFPKLKKLKFSECLNWSEWEDITAEEAESAAVSVMPCLAELRIVYCEGLKKLPHRLLRKASSSLQILKLFNSSELQKSYGDDPYPNIIPIFNFVTHNND